MVNSHLQQTQAPALQDDKCIAVWKLTSSNQLTGLKPHQTLPPNEELYQILWSTLTCDPLLYSHKMSSLDAELAAPGRFYLENSVLYTVKFKKSEVPEPEVARPPRAPAPQSRRLAAAPSLDLTGDKAAGASTAAPAPAPAPPAIPEDTEQALMIKLTEALVNPNLADGLFIPKTRAWEIIGHASSLSKAFELIMNPFHEPDEAITSMQESTFAAPVVVDCADPMAVLLSTLKNGDMPAHKWNLQVELTESTSAVGAGVLKQAVSTACTNLIGMLLKASPKLAGDTLGCEDNGSGALWRG